MTEKNLRWLMVCVFLGCGGGGSDSADAGADAPPTAGSGRVVGTVYTPTGDGVDVVAGARVEIAGGASTVADAYGAFVLDGVAEGTPLTIVVSGPEPGADGVDEVYGTHQLRVTALPGVTAVVTAHLLRGCRTRLDGAAGGTAGADRCAGAGGLTVTFPAQAFARPTGEAFTGDVLLEMTAVDPETPGDLAALPADGLGADGPTILGGVEVRLFEAETGEPLVLRGGASATLRFEIAPVPAELAGEDPSLEWYDPATGAWVPEGTGTVIADGSRVYLETTVTHFTTYRSVACCIPGPMTCLLVIPRICSDAACSNPTVCPSGQCSVEITDLAGRGRLPDVPLEPNGLTGVACLPVAPNRSFLMTFKHYDAASQSSVEQRRRVDSSSCLEVPGSSCGAGVPASCTPMSCTNIFNRNDRGGAGVLDLYPRAFSCAHGSFLTASGDPVIGALDVLVDGNVVASLDLPAAGVCDTGASMCGADPVCEASFCAEVPVGFVDPGTQIAIRDRSGNQAFVDPPPVPAPGTAAQCPADRPAACGLDASPPCLDVGQVATVCDQAPEYGCMVAAFTADVGEDAVACPDPSRPFLVALDATASSGPVHWYEWFVDGVFQAAINQPDATFEVCVAAGTHRIRLETVASRRPLLRLRGRAERIVVAGRGPCTVTATSSPAGSWSTQCTYGSTLRVCDTTLPGYTPTRTTYADAPCGYPCVTGFFSPHHPELFFEPLPRPVAQLAIPGSASRVDYEVDGFGNWTAATTYDAAGALVARTLYSYDDPARPTVVQSMAEGSSTVYTSRLIWLDGRLDAFETQVGLGTPLTLTYAYAPTGELESVDARNTMTGAPFGAFTLTRGAETLTVTGGLLAIGSDYTATWNFNCL